MYYGEFNERADISASFAIDDFDGTVIFASYNLDCYDGSAVVIFVHDSKFYLVQASHCSCYGLEESWCPEEMTAQSLVHILREGRLYGVGNQKELADKIEIIDVVKGSPEAIEGVMRS